jgi:hypothetical protein
VPAAVPAAVTTVVAVLTLMTGTALASPKGHASAHQATVSHSEKAHHEKAGHRSKAKPKRVVELTGVLTDTPTATIATTSSDTATATITMAVKGGERRMHRTVVTLTVNAATVVRRGDKRATAADLVTGDHLSVKARRLADGSWLALRINASAPRQPKVAKPDDD